MSQVAVNGQIWKYEEIGNGKDVPLLILHGWGRSGEEWINTAKELSVWSGRRVFVVDLPGFGGSSLPAQVGLPKVKNIFEYSNLIIEFCKYLDLKKVIVIGHSLGGRVGIVMASRYPIMVDKLILIDPAGVKSKSVKRVAMQSLAMIFGWVPKSLRRKIASYGMDEDYRNSPALRELYRAIVKDELRGELPRINSDVILVWGERDVILPLSLTNIYRKLLPSSRLRVVWGAGHDPHLTNYEQTLAILQESIE